MHLSVLSSLGLMLVLMSAVLHLAAMFTRGWSRASGLLPSRGVGEPAVPDAGHPANSSSWSATAATPRRTQGLDSSLPWEQAKYLRISLWLWDWCQGLQELSPQCHVTGSLRVVQGLDVVALVCMVTCLILLQLMCHMTSDLPRRKTFVQVSATVLCFLTFCLLVAVIVIFVAFVHRDLTRLLTEPPALPPFTPQLGWPLGADAVSAVLLALASALLCCDLRAKPRNTVPYALVA